MKNDNKSNAVTKFVATKADSIPIPMARLCTENVTPTPNLCPS